MQPLPENDLDSYFNEGLEQQAMFKRQAEENVNLLHRVFVQSEAGAKLLEKWKNDLVMIPSILPESTQFGAGLTEGGKMFVRNIIAQVQSVEKGNE